MADDLRRLRALTAAKARLDTLDLYPEPVDISRLRVLVWPWFFRIPGYRRYDGYAFWRTIVVRSLDEDLMTHELCHVWQGQHHSKPLVLSTYATVPYRRNPFEAEARAAVEATR
jgi:hypothetical protein